MLVVESPFLSDLQSDVKFVPSTSHIVVLNPRFSKYPPWWPDFQNYICLSCLSGFGIIFAGITGLTLVSLVNNHDDNRNAEILYDVHDRADELQPDWVLSSQYLCRRNRIHLFSPACVFYFVYFQYSDLYFRPHLKNKVHALHQCMKIFLMELV